MSSKDDKCFVCLKTGLKNVNIFTTYNVRNIKEKEELYVDVIKNCYNIEISPDSGLTTLCHECSMKLKKAYNFRHEILQAIENLISAQAEVTNNKEYSEIEYLEDIPFDDDYDINPVLDSETGQLSYTLDEIYDGKEINASDETEFLLHVDNDTVVDKVIFNDNVSNSNDNVSEIIQSNDLDIEKAGSDLDLEPKETYLLDKPVENYSINILSDIIVDNDLEPGQIRVIDKIDNYLIDPNHEITVDTKKVIVKSVGKTHANDNNVLKAVVHQEAGPLDIVDNIPENITKLVDEINKASKDSINKKRVTRKTKNKDKKVLNQATLVKLNDLIKSKRKIYKRVVKEKKYELSLLARMCTKQRNPDEDTKNKDKTNQAETRPEKNKRKGRKSAIKEKKDELSLLARICTEHPNPDENTITKNKPVVNEAETIVKIDANDLIKDKTEVSQKVVEEKKDELSLLARICTEHPNPDEDTKNKDKTNQAETRPEKNKRNGRKSAIKEKKDELSLLARICTEHPNPDENTITKNKPVVNEAETIVKIDANDLIKDKTEATQRSQKVVEEKKDELSLLARICTEHPNPDEDTKNRDETNQAETRLEKNKRKGRKLAMKVKDELSLLARICTEHPNPDENTIDENTITKNKTVVNVAESLVKLDANDLIKDKINATQKVVKEKKDELNLLAWICTEHSNPDEDTKNREENNQAETRPEKNKRKGHKLAMKEKTDELSLLARICTEHPNPDENTITKNKIVVNEADNIKATQKVAEEKKDELNLLACICTEHPNPDEDTKNREENNQAETRPEKNKRKGRKLATKEKTDELSLLARICTEHPNPDENTITKNKIVVNEADKTKATQKVVEEKKDKLSLLAQICTEHPNPDEDTKNREENNQAETRPEKNKRKGRKLATKEKTDELSLLARICTEHPNPDEDTITINKTLVDEAETLVNINTNDLIKDKKQVSKRVGQENKHELILLAPICTEKRNPDETMIKKDITVLNQPETIPEKDKSKRCKRVVEEKKDELSVLARICTEHQNPDEDIKNKDKTEPNQAETIPEKDKRKRCKRVVKEKKDELSLLARICTEHQNSDEDTKNTDKTVVNEAETLVKLDANDLIKDKTKLNKKVMKEKKDKSSILEQICTEQQNLDEALNQAETFVKLNTNDLMKVEKQMSKKIVKEKKDELSVLARNCTEHRNPDEDTNNKDEVLNQSETLVKLHTNKPMKDKKKVCKRVAKQKKGKLILLAPISTEQNSDKTIINKDKTVVNEAVTLVKLSPNDLIKVKKKVSKRVVKKKKDELNVKEINDQKPRDEATNLVNADVDDENASTKSKSKKRKKEASVKENLSANIKAKKPRKEKKEKTPPPFTLQPNQTACDICPVQFETAHALSTHMNTHYPQFVCGECGLRYANRNRLRQHQRTHDQGPFICKICDKQFSNSNTRNAHTWRVHSKGDPFKCKHCDMRFPTYLQRLRHVQSTHGETPKYACQFCDAKFAYAAYRTKHIRTMHLRERPHQCQHCPAAFARARNLAAHLASKHGEGQKSYRCPICGMTFYFRNSLRWHVTQHNHKYPCNQCDQKFATNAELESHIQIHEHADNMAINLDFVTSLHLDALADDYALIDPSYLDLNEL